MGIIRVYNKSGLKKAVSRKYDTIEIRGELEREITKIVDKNKSKNNAGKGATLIGIAGAVTYHAINLPLAVIFDIVLVGGIGSIGLSRDLKKYNLRMDSENKYFLSRKR
jgi:hypothetical protein